MIYMYMYEPSTSNLNWSCLRLEFEFFESVPQGLSRGLLNSVNFNEIAFIMDCEFERVTNLVESLKITISGLRSVWKGVRV